MQLFRKKTVLLIGLLLISSLLITFLIINLKGNPKPNTFNPSPFFCCSNTDLKNAALALENHAFVYSKAYLFIAHQKQPREAKIIEKLKTLSNKQLDIPSSFWENSFYNYLTLRKISFLEALFLFSLFFFLIRNTKTFPIRLQTKLAMLFVLSCFLLAIKSYDSFIQKYAIVIEKQAYFYENSSKKSKFLGKLHEGKILKIRQKKGGFYSVKLNQTKQAWTSEKNLLILK